MPVGPMSETIRKQLLVAEVLILAQEVPHEGNSVNFLSREVVESMTIDEVAAAKRELRDLARSLGRLG